MWFWVFHFQTAVFHAFRHAQRRLVSYVLCEWSKGCVRARHRVLRDASSSSPYIAHLVPLAYPQFEFLRSNIMLLFHFLKPYRNCRPYWQACYLNFIIIEYLGVVVVLSLAHHGIVDGLQSESCESVVVKHAIIACTDVVFDFQYKFQLNL